MGQPNTVHLHFKYHMGQPNTVHLHFKYHMGQPNTVHLHFTITVWTKLYFGDKLE